MSMLSLVGFPFRRVEGEGDYGLEPGVKSGVMKKLEGEEFQTHLFFISLWSCTFPPSSPCDGAPVLLGESASSIC
jgi:hypothetical protein